jgi:4-amino-4-deoxy-L-arabinose transferase-like glycosyltransferase
VTDPDPDRIGRRPLWLLFALALVLRVGAAIDYAHHHPGASRPVIDEASYERWALEIAGGDWIGDEVFFQEPLYPYWLGAIYAVWGFGDDADDVMRRRRTAARHVQALYGAIAAVLLALVTARVFGRRAGIVAGLAFATYPPLYFFPALFLKPNLVVPLLCALPLLTAWLRGGPGGAWRWGCLGVGAGLGALLRGNLLLLLPAFVALPCVVALVERRRLAGALGAAAAVAIGSAAVLLPVALRNDAVGGVFALTTSGAGTNLYGGNNADNPYGLATEFDWVRGVPEHEAADWRHEAERRTGRLLDPGEVSSYWIGATLDSLRAEPWMHARILWNKLRLTLGAYEVPDNHHLGWDARYVSALRVPLPGFGVWGVLGLAGMIAFALRRRLGSGVGVADARGAWELLGFFALYLATIVLTVTSMRIRLALVPLLLPFAGYLVDLVLRRVRPAAWLPGLALAVAIVHWPVLPAEMRAVDLLERDYNHAVQLLQAERLDEAAGAIAGIAAERPNSVQAALLQAELAARRAMALRAAGASAAEVERELDLALGLLRPVATGDSIAPIDSFRAQKLAGLVQFETGNWRVAIDRLRDALAFDPSDRQARVSLGEALCMRSEEVVPEERRRLLVEARAIFVALAGEEPDAGHGVMLERIDAALAE